MEESRVKKTSINIISAFLLQFVKLALVFVNRIIFVKILGASYLGVNGLFSNVLGILSLADLGMTTALMYSLYEPLARNDKEKIKIYMNYFKKIYNIIALTVAVVGICLIPFLKYLVNLPENMPNIYLYYILLLANSVISYLFVYKTTLVSADQKSYLINKYDTIFQFVLFVAQILVLLLTKSFALYLAMNVICSLASNIVKVRKAEKIYPYLKENNIEKINKKEKNSIFENLKSLFLYKIGGVIQNNTDNILISIFVGTISVGYYSNYTTIINAITTFLTLIFTSLKASMGNYVVSKDKKSQLKMFNVLEIYNFWLVGFCAICFMALIPDFINICFGSEYVLSESLLICACLNFYTSNSRQVIWTYRETTGIFKKTKYITLVTAILNIFLSIIFGKIYGLAGIVGATVLSRMIYAWWKEPTVLFGDYFKTSPKQYYFNYIKRLALLCVIAGGVLAICNCISISNIYVLFIVKCIICCIVPTLCFYIIYRKSEAMTYLKDNVIKKFKRS